jgi:hypothetical protein
MPTLLEKALAYLDALEVDRQAALALSEQKAEEAKLIQARQEGFGAAMKMLSAGTFLSPMPCTIPTSLPGAAPLDAYPS